jgi:hypothetical protein
MRLFHVSENPTIKLFEPMKPKRVDLDQSTALVWAICERTLPNFLTPRDCPRVTYHVSTSTTKEDKLTYFSSSLTNHCVAIEQAWFEALLKTELTIYEFDPKNFVLQDDIAGYYVSHQTEVPINQFTIKDIPKALFENNIELRILPELFTLRDRIIKSSLNWSMCRMKHAKK